MPFNFEKATLLHDNQYDYSLVEFKNVDTKVNIMCKIHGVFSQTPYHHISRSQGCPKCKGLKIRECKKKTTKWFIEKAKNIHGEKYDYSKVEYVRAHDNLIIVCKKHGEFLQNANNHLYNKTGCPSCGYNASNQSNLWLDSLGVGQKYRENVLFIANKKYKVDAYVCETNTIYEYFGKFWHGHPDVFDPESINPRNKIKFGKLYSDTLERIKVIENSPYNFIYTWG
jgi:hypothetical protein